jgi:hypothetical protein
MSHVLKAEEGALIDTPEYKAMKDAEYAWKNQSAHYKQVSKYAPHKAAKALAGLHRLHGQMLAAQSVLVKMKNNRQAS